MKDDAPATSDFFPLTNPLRKLQQSTSFGFLHKSGTSE
jgi:hypothetical protein